MLNVTTVVQVVPPVTQDATLNVGAVKPLVATAEKATLSTAQPNPPQPDPAGKPPSAVAVIVADGPAAPLRADTLLALEVIATNGGLTKLLNNVPDCMVSGTAVLVPFEIVTQTPPATLVLVQPVWNPTEIPEAVVVPTTLKIAVNRSPEVGEAVVCPSAPTITRWYVSILSVGAQTEP